MKRPLYISGAGSVTSAGLTAPQTCAAFRAGLSAFEEVILAEPFGAVQIVSRIPTHWSLRKTEGEWLVNMAARAIKEALSTGDTPSKDTVILLAPPESQRNHPCYEDILPADFLQVVIKRSGQIFHPSSRAIDGGPAAILTVLDRVGELLEAPEVSQVLLGGTDSLLHPTELARYGTAGRLKGSDNAQGFVPGEGAVVLRITAKPDTLSDVQVQIVAAGSAAETNPVTSEDYSQGAGLWHALDRAVTGQGADERDLAFVVSNGNGERYSGWEALIARTRFYKTRREYLATAYPAMSFGDTGSASGALALMIAADSFHNSYAPGQGAMCEIASEHGLRSTAVVRAVAQR